MITRRTKIQLLVFVLITVFGVTFVGARYARLDRLFYDDTYTVVAHFPDSGGIFAGGEVTYRGVGIGQVGKLELTNEGVDVYLEIDKDEDSIPADTLAVVGNRSAVGEQYVELQPRTNSEPYLEGDSEIAEADTRIPIATETLLGNLSTTVTSVDRDALRTATTEVGIAFAGTGPDLQRIIDTGNSFIETASENFDVTADLIEDSNVVLNGQLASASAIRTFSRQLAQFSTSLVEADPDLRSVIDNGSATANQLRTFLEQNGVELGELVNNLVTTGEVVIKHLDGIEQILVLYPYVVEGGFTVVAKSPDTGLYDAHFGAIFTDTPICKLGYGSTDERGPEDRGNRPMNERARCTEPPTVSNPRGAQNKPDSARAGASFRPPTVASYDSETGKLTWGGREDSRLAPTGSVAPKTLGEESWKWLFLQPLMSTQE
ncbi:MAG: MlaD family protein [Nocardioidaceae bacterium]